MKRVWIPQVLLSLMLLWALHPENPYGYYMLLRWVSCGVFAYLAVQANQLATKGWVWVLGVTAAIYNPILPADLTREIWMGVNVVSAAIALASIFVLRPRGHRSKAE